MPKITANGKRIKRAISEAFIALLQKTPFKKITVQNILDKAEVHRATFYHYYFDKYDLAKSIIDHLAEEFIEAVESPGSGSHSIYTYIEKNADALQAVFSIHSPDFDTSAESVDSFCKVYRQRAGNDGAETMFAALFYAYIMRIGLISSPYSLKSLPPIASFSPPPA